MNNRKIILIACLVGLVLLFISYSRLDVNALYSSFSHFNAIVLLAYVLVIFTMDILYAMRWDLILKAHRINLPFRTVFSYNLGMFGAGFLTSTYIGGEPVRILLLDKHHVTAKKAISTGIIDKSIQLTTDLLFVAVGMVLLFFHFAISRRIKTTAFVAIFVIFSFLAVYYYSMLNKKRFFTAIFDFPAIKSIKSLNRLQTDIGDVERLIHRFFESHRDEIPWLLGINFFLMLLVLTEYSLVLVLFNIHLTVFSVLIVILAVSISYGIPVPMAMGTLEVFESAAMSFISINPVTGIAISLLIRVKDILRASLGFFGMFYSGVSWKSITKIK